MIQFVIESPFWLLCGGWTRVGFTWGREASEEAVEIKRRWD